MSQLIGTYQLFLAMIILLQTFNVPFVSCEDVSAEDPNNLADAPYEQLYFKIDVESNLSFNKYLKYPSYRRCVIPEHSTKHKTNETGGQGQGKSGEKTWRLYWSVVAWSAYFYENGNELANWELEKESPDLSASSWHHSFVAVLIMIIWIILAAWACLFIFPILAMIIFRGLYKLWDFATNRFFITICRWFVIKIVKTRRDRIRRVFKNAGHKPPIFRYSLPKSLRRHDGPNDGVPKELDESEDEFWSSDDELNNLGKSFETEKQKQSVYKPTPEFVPEYPAEVEEQTQLLSHGMFVYLKKVKNHGMFAVWTEGTEDLNLTGISTSHWKSEPAKVS